MTSNLSSDDEELRLLYQITTSDLSYFKSQQWSVTYYCFLIDAALIGVAQLVLPLRATDKVLLSSLILVAAISALVVLWKLENSISIRMSRLEAIRTRFGAAFGRAWSAAPKRPERVHSVYLLRGGVILTGALSLWLINLRLVAA
jgi:hypothetical protein